MKIPLGELEGGFCYKDVVTYLLPKVGGIYFNSSYKQMLHNECRARLVVKLYLLDFTWQLLDSAFWSAS